MITVSFENRGKCGLCECIYNSIKSQITLGILKANEKLPSKRLLAQNLGVSVITVQNAYFQLISEGYIYSIERSGFFVTELPQIKKNPEKKLPEIKQKEVLPYFADFRNNSISFEKFPFNVWSHTMRQVLNSGDEKLLSRIEIKGELELRKSISAHLREFRNMNVSSEQIVIGSGSENLYTMVVQLLGNNNIFAVENPGYHKVFSVCSLNGAKVFPVKIDSSGIDINELEKSLVNVVHVSPNHHFPTGIVMPIRRRQELLSWAEKSKSRFIIEDDYDSEFRFNGKPLPTLQSADQNDCVIYINTFSKTLAPSFRISFMVLPQRLLNLFEQKFNIYSCSVSSFEQYTLAKFIQDGNYGKHIIRMKNYYRNLRNTLISNIEASRLKDFCKIQEQEAGLHFLLSVKSSLGQEELVNRLQMQGINLSPIEEFYYENPPKEIKNTFVVNYSGIKKEKIPEIVKRMERALLKHVVF